MQSFYPERFERDMATTESEWLLRLPLAVGEQPWKRKGTTVLVTLGSGHLQIGWQPLPPRVIALLPCPGWACNLSSKEWMPRRVCSSCGVST